MSVRFASANHPAHRLGWCAARRGLIAPALARSANDNAGAMASAFAPGSVQLDPLLGEALRHFAVHGLAAAETARSAADEAAARGDRPARDHWLAITRMFDRRLATRQQRDLTPA
jgi:hypothetical protein